MQSGIDSSRARIAAETIMPTKVDIRPDGSQGSQEAASGSTKGIFGEDGATFSDVLDAINPLNHIPIVSDIVANVRGREISTASKLIGGAVLGGPIGFVASLAKVIFEDGAGMSPTNAVYAAVTGEFDKATEVAATEAIEEPVEEVASVETAVDPVDTAELASLAPSAAPAAVIANEMARANTIGRAAGKGVLDLYGDSTSSAHASYKKAQLLPYLRDVSTSKVL